MAADPYRHAALAARTARAADLSRFLASQIAAVERQRRSTPSVRSVRSVSPGVAVVRTNRFPLLICIVDQAEIDPVLLEAGRAAGLTGWIWERLQSRAAVKSRLERGWQPACPDNDPSGVLASRRERVAADSTGSSRLYEIWVETVEPAESALAHACPSFATACGISRRRMWACSSSNRLPVPGIPSFHPLARIPYMPQFLAACPELAAPEAAGAATLLEHGRGRPSALALGW
jgi:hypothetical protein